MSLVDKKDVGKRITQLQEHLGLTSRKFALSIKADPSYISKVEKGEKSLSKTALDNIVKEHRVNRDWILIGKEPILNRGTNVPRESIVAEDEVGVSDEASAVKKELISVLKSQNQYLQKIIDVNLERIHENQVLTQALLKAQIKRVSERFVKDDPKKTAAELEKINKHTSDYLGSGLTVGSDYSKGN